MAEAQKRRFSFVLRGDHMANFLTHSLRNTLLVIGGGVAALAVACGGNNSGNNTPDLGSGADLSTGNPDLATVATGPTITGIAPAKATTTGGTTVTISGTNFAPGATVKMVFGTTTVTIANPTISADGKSIVFNAPANTGKPGVYDVTVTNPDSMTAMQAKGFTYYLGTVSFAAGATLTGNALDRGPRSVVAADMNKDGNLDLVVAYANSNTVAVFLGDGTGKFTAKTTQMGVGTYPYSVTVGDVDGDNKLDVVTPNQGGPSVSILFGAGDGTLGTPTTVNSLAGSQPQSAVLVDADNDNKVDVVVSNFYSGMATPTNNLTVLLNKGGTTFTPSQMTVGGSLYALAAADFDKNGKLDAVGVHRLAAGMASVTTLINKGGNTSPFFTTAGNQSGGGEPLGVASADFDSDGKLDLAIGNNVAASNNVAIAKGSGLAQNTFADPVAQNLYPVGNANARVEHLVASDIDLDGTPDVVTANFNPALAGVGNLSLLLNNGGNAIGFKAAQTITVTATADPNWVAVGDFNKDGIPDLVTTDYKSTGGGVIYLQGTGQ